MRLKVQILLIKKILCFRLREKICSVDFKSNQFSLSNYLFWDQLKILTLPKIIGDSFSSQQLLSISHASSTKLHKWVERSGCFSFEQFLPKVSTQRTLNIGGSITVRLTSCLNTLDSTKQVLLIIIQN